MAREDQWTGMTATTGNAVLATALALTGILTLAVGLLALADKDQSPWATTVLSGLVIAAAAARVWPRFHLPRLRMRFALPSAVVMLAASMTWAINGGSGVSATNIVLAPLVALAVASLARDERSRMAVMVCFAMVLGVIATAALVKWYLGDDVGQALTAGSSQSLRYSIRLFGHPNNFGMALAMLIPFAAAGVVFVRHRLLFLISLASVAVGLAALFLTQSRAAWVGCALGLLVVAPNWRVRAIVTAAALAATAIVGPQVVNRLAAEDYQDNVRISIWRVSLDVVQDHPLLGVGVGNFRENVAPVAFADEPYPVPPPHAHNVILNYAAEVGAPAACALIILAIAVIVALVRIRSHQSQSTVAVTRACMGALTAMIVTGQFDATIDQRYTLLIAAAIVGLSCAVTKPGVSCEPIDRDAVPRNPGSVTGV